MRTRLLCLLAIPLVLQAPGLAGAAPTATQVSDRCGDAGSRVRAQGRDVVLDADAGAWDLRSSRVRTLYSGGQVSALQATVSVCGMPSMSNDYAAFWGLPNGCELALEYIARDLVLHVVTPEVRLAEPCYQHSDGLDSYTGADVVSQAVLPASYAVLSGHSVVITVPVTAIPAAIRPWLAKGTRWSGFSSGACDPNGCADVFTAGSSMASPELLASVRLDVGWADGRYVVGQDAPR